MSEETIVERKLALYDKISMRHMKLTGRAMDLGFDDIESALDALPEKQKELITLVTSITVPPDVIAAVERMCTPLDKSWLTGATAEADARSMAIIKQFIDSIGISLTSGQAWRGLWDTQWMNIVNHDHAFENYSKDDAVHLAVKMTEEKLRENNAQLPSPVLSDADAQEQS